MKSISGCNAANAVVVFLTRSFEVRSASFKGVMETKLFIFKYSAAGLFGS